MGWRAKVGPLGDMAVSFFDVSLAFTLSAEDRQNAKLSLQAALPLNGPSNPAQISAIRHFTVAALGKVLSRGTTRGNNGLAVLQLHHTGLPPERQGPGSFWGLSFSSIPSQAMQDRRVIPSAEVSANDWRGYAFLVAQVPCFIAGHVEHGAAVV